MSRPTCAITGANGFVGGAALRRFQALGCNVVALIRQQRLAPEGCEARPFTLGELQAPDLLSDVDVLIHAAYDFSLRSWADICRVNVVGSEYLFDAATRAGVERQIFISSMAAFEGCRSYYGLAKLMAENAVRIRGGTVVRPGVIYGERNGGLAADVAALVKKFPIVPMIGTGRYPLYTCHVDDLCALLTHVAQIRPVPDAILTAANPLPVTLRTLVKRRLGASPFIFPLPWQLIAAGLWVAQCMGLCLRFRSDSVVSIVHANKSPDFLPTKGMPVSFRPFADPKWSLATQRVLPFGQ